VYMRITA